MLHFGSQQSLCLNSQSIQRYSTGFDTAAYRMTVPEGYARYAVIEGFGPGGAGLTIATESAPAGAFQVDQLPTIGIQNRRRALV